MNFDEIKSEKRNIQSNNEADTGRTFFSKLEAKRELRLFKRNVYLYRYIDLRSRVFTKSICT